MNLTELQMKREARNNQMWASLIPGYQEANRNKKKKLKEVYKMSGFSEVSLLPSMKKGYIAFDSCVVQESKACVPKNAPRKGNDNMYVEQNMTVTEKTVEDARRSYFIDQLSDIWAKKDHELREKFGLCFNKSPKTPKELVEWIKAGEFTFTKEYDPEDDESWERYEHPICGIRWTKIKEDRKGYNEAYKLLNEERTKYTRELWAEIEPANFIKILEKFEKSKLH